MTRVLRFVWLLPRNALIAVLRGYRAIVSPLYGDVCRYYPSCSAYALGSVQQRGAVRGSVLSVWRVLRCNPWTEGGIDDVVASGSRVVLTPFGFVGGALSVAHTDRSAENRDAATTVEFTGAGTHTSRRPLEHAHSHERADQR